MKFIKYNSIENVSHMKTMAQIDLQGIPKEDWVVSEKIHGCLQEGTLIETDRGKIPIEMIVNNKLDYKILSYNTDSNELEYDEIINYQNVSNDDNLEWFEIETNNGKKLIVTENHEIWVPKEKKYLTIKELYNRNNLTFVLKR